MEGTSQLYCFFSIDAAVLEVTLFLLPPPLQMEMQLGVGNLEGRNKSRRLRLAS